MKQDQETGAKRGEMEEEIAPGGLLEMPAEEASAPPVEPAGETGEFEPAPDLAAQLAAERLLRQEAEEKALRWRADYENVRRRALADAETARFQLAQEYASRFLPVLDDLERALASMEGEASPAWRSGVEMVRRRLLVALDELGLTRIETVGRIFDPLFHEAIMRVEDSGLPANTVVEELRSGFRLGEKVIRPAMVKVQG